jgi:hypothetical protein
MREFMMEGSLPKKHLVSGVALAGVAVIGALAWRRLRLHVFQRQTLVYLNGNLMCEGVSNDYVWEGREPRFNFVLSAGSSPDVVVLVTDPLRKVRVLQATAEVIGEDKYEKKVEIVLRPPPA